MDFDELVRFLRHRHRGNPEMLEIIELLVQVLDRLTQPPILPPVQVPSGIRLLRLGGTLQLTMNQTVHYVLEEDDSAGNPVGQDIGTAEWTSDNPAVLTIAPSADGYSSVGTPVAGGTSNVTAHVTGTNPDGTPFDITGTDVVTVVGNDVVAAKLTGTVVDNTPAPAPTPAPPADGGTPPADTGSGTPAA